MWLPLLGAVSAGAQHQGLVTNIHGIVFDACVPDLVAMANLPGLRGVRQMEGFDIFIQILAI